MVSDANNIAGWGGIIRFYSEESKVKIETNTTAAKAANLSISSRLLSVSHTSHTCSCLNSCVFSVYGFCIHFLHKCYKNPCH